MLKKLSILFLSVVLLFSSVSLAASQSSIIVDKLSAKITTMFDWDKQKQLDLWTVVIKKLDKIAERNDLTEKQKKLYLNIKEEMESRQVETFKEMFEEKVDKMYNEEKEITIVGVNWLCNVDLDRIEKIWNWFYSYENKVLTNRFSYSYSHRVGVEEGEIYLDYLPGLDSRFFKVIKDYWDNYETVGDWFYTQTHNLEIEYKGSRYFIWYPGCWKCWGERFSVGVFSDNWKKLWKNILNNELYDYHCKEKIEEKSETVDLQNIKNPLTEEEKKSVIERMRELEDRNTPYKGKK